MKFDETIGQEWINSTRSAGNPVIISDTLGTVLNAKQALAGSIVLARRIKKISTEQNIGIMLPTSAAGMLVNMAGMLLGKTVVNLNFTSSITAILSAMEQANIQTIYSSSRFLDKLQSRGIDVTLLQEKASLIMLEELSSKTSVLEKAGTLLLCKFAPTKLLKKRYCSLQNDLNKPAVILFSSGSEGEPKGVILSHHNLLTNVNQIKEVLKFKPHDVIMANLPLFHSFGLTVTQFLPLLMRIPVVCHGDPIDVAGIAKAVLRFKATLMFGTSTLFRLYIRNNKIKPEQLKSLRLLVAGAEKLQPEVLQEFIDKFQIEIYEGYGATETSPVAAVNIPEHLSDEYGDTNTTFRAGSVGLPLSGTKFKIVDPDSFSPLPALTAGMLLIQGGQVMQGYVNDPTRTALALRTIDDEVWYVTGDKCYLDEDGFLFIQDRYSRFAKIGGEMIALVTIETTIKSVLNDKSLEVLAVNVPDIKKGEKIIVLCTKALDELSLREKLSAEGMTALALPAVYLQVDKIPQLGSGKTDYSEAKKLALTCC